MTLKKRVNKKDILSHALRIVKDYLLIALVSVVSNAEAQRNKSGAPPTAKDNKVFTDLLLNKPIHVSGTILNHVKDLKTIKFIVNNAVTSIQEVNIADLDESGHFSC